MPPGVEQVPAFPVAARLAVARLPRLVFGQSLVRPDCA